MLNYAGELSDPERREVLPINNAFEDLEIAYVTVASVNSEIDTNMESLYLVPPCALNPCHDSSFSHALNQCVEISKMMPSIGNTFVDKSVCLLLHDPIIVPFDAHESQLSLFFGGNAINTIQSIIGAIQDTGGKGVPKYHLSNIWVISQYLANSEINHTTQLLCNHADSNLSRQYSTNGPMLQYKRIHSILFIDRVVVQTTLSTCPSLMP